MVVGEEEASILRHGDVVGCCNLRMRERFGMLHGIGARLGSEYLNSGVSSHHGVIEQLSCNGINRRLGIDQPQFNLRVVLIWICFCRFAPGSRYAHDVEATIAVDARESWSLKNMVSEPSFARRIVEVQSHDMVV